VLKRINSLETPRLVVQVNDLHIVLSVLQKAPHSQTVGVLLPAAKGHRVQLLIGLIVANVLVWLGH
jgi:hypothetical protein